MVRTMCVAAVLVLTLQVAADDKKPDPKAYGEAMMKAGMVTENHKKLEPLVGSFEFSIKFWMDPSQPAQESKGTSDAQWMLGGRFVRQQVAGDFGGMPFNGVGVIGYDNLRKTYVSGWLDNMSTSLSTATGELSTDGKVLTFTGEEIDPLSGQKLKTREVTTFVDANTNKSLFYKTMGGNEMKVMEIVYTRKK